MKQLYYTHGEAGKETTGGPGPQVRAASAGIDPYRQQAAVALAGYAPPAGLTDDDPAPVRLALLSSPDAGRVLIHSVTVPGEPAGNFFSHVLLNLPATIDAQNAIQTWNGPGWQQRDHGGGHELPDVLYPPVTDALNDAALAKFLADPAHRSLLDLTLTALTAATPARRVYLAAPAADVAQIIYGVTRALPTSLLEDFTFSTYERDPLNGNARITGTSWVARPKLPAPEEGAEYNVPVDPPAPPQDLPEVCYSFADGNAAYNTYTGRKTELPEVAPFADFATEALASGKLAALDEFRHNWQRLGVKEAGLLDLVFRLSRGGAMTKEESETALQNPALASWIAPRPDALQQLLDWALDDAAYATATFSRVVVALRQKPDALAKLGQTVQDRGLAFLKEGDRTRTANALEGLLPMVAPARATNIFTEILGKVTDPDSLAWDVRWYLLPRLARLKPLAVGQTIDPALAKWFRVPADQLAPLLRLDLPRAYQLAASLGCLDREGSATPSLAKALAEHPALVLPLLQQVAAEKDGTEKAGQVFDAVLAESPGHPWVEELVRQGKTLPIALLDRCLEAALNAGRLDAEPVVRHHGALLLELLAGKKSLDRIAEKFLEQPPADVVQNRTLLTFLEKLLDDGGIGTAVQTRARAILTLDKFVRQPSLDPDAMAGAADALVLEPAVVPAAVRGQVLGLVADELGRKATSPDVQTDLENVLLKLGRLVPGGAGDLYRELLRPRQHDRGFWKNLELPHAFLAVALGAVNNGELAPQVDNLAGDAFTLAMQASKSGGAKLITALDARTENWPKNARTQWGFLAKAVTPRGLEGVGRDALMVAAGFVAGAIVTYVLKFFEVL